MRKIVSASLLAAFLLIGCGTGDAQEGSSIRDKAPPAAQGQTADAPPLVGRSNMSGNRLQSAIERGLQRDGDLADELRELGEYEIRSRADATAICDALSKIDSKADSGSYGSRLSSLIGLFQDVPSADVPAFSLLYRNGLPLLCKHFDNLFESPTEDQADDLLMILKVLAMYGSDEATERIVRAVRKPLKPGDYLWSMVLGQVGSGHADREEIFRQLSDPLPPGFIAVSLMDAATGAALEGELEQHPFDTAQGKAKLKEWLTDKDSDHFSYAQSATATLPFLSAVQRDELLSLAMEHPDKNVQLEGAWASAKLGGESDLKILGRWCLDPNYSAKARRYLDELGRADLIPAEAKDPNFEAKAEFANWLAHPNELGQPPDELEIVDSRELAWPPEREKKRFWLIKYVVKDSTGLADDDVDCGLVGSMTFCLFSSRLAERPPEDGYAIHCYWEMQGEKLIEETNVENPKKHESFLTQWTGGKLENAEVVTIAELSPRLRYPQRRVALAAATLDGEQGWVVLDGPRSTWYATADMPKDEHATKALDIHVGRQLLGFKGQPDRRKYLAAERPQRRPEQVVTAYEKFMAQAEDKSSPLREKLLTDWNNPLGKHFDAYVDARVAMEKRPRSELVIETYDRMFRAAQAGPVGEEDPFDSLSLPIASKFEDYVDALVATGNVSKVMAKVEFFAPRWEHNLGYGQLGSAAFKVANFDLAEEYFLKLREGSQDWHRFEEMAMLAEIWLKLGKTEEASLLLIDCLKKSFEESKSATRFDRKGHEERFQRQLTDLHRLLPDSAEQLRKKHDIPATTKR